MIRKEGRRSLIPQYLLPEPAGSRQADSCVDRLLGIVTVEMLGFPSTDTCVPTAIVLAAFYIKAESYCLTAFKRILIGTVSEKSKKTFLG